VCLCVEIRFVFGTYVHGRRAARACVPACVCLGHMCVCVPVCVCGLCTDAGAACDLVDDMGMLYVHAGNTDNVNECVSASQRALQHLHGPVPYLKDPVPRDTHGVPVWDITH